MDARHAEVAPESRYVGEVTVPLARLDAVELPRSDAVLLKVDVQGAERAVLEGAPETLERVRLLELELSVVELYTGQPLLPEMLAELTARGFVLAALRPSLADPRTGRLLQLDGLLLNEPG
jgi:hypothetical protein